MILLIVPSEGNMGGTSQGQSLEKEVSKGERTGSLSKGDSGRKAKLASWECWVGIPSGEWAGLL